MRLATTLLAILAVAFLAGCADAPGADGRYATHDHGRDNDHSRG